MATSSPARSITADQVRDQFLSFFQERAGHVFVPSSPVVPANDPTLLFANAGMNQFKPIFLGEAPAGSDLASLRRAVNTQKCIRAGGKHNDLDDVGKDTYHHTFFEMLGNWSFGDYFKAEAIQWAWELLTDIWGLDPERLYATYFEGDRSQGLDADREAYDLWLKHLPPERVLPGNTKDNFWEMGDTGPCGPCSELHYDGRSDAERAQTPGYTLVNRDHPDVIEVWNLVFIQFNREPGGLMTLPAKHVDTGMGFERIVRVLQGKDSNYDTDVFAPLFARIQEVMGARAYQPGGRGEMLRDPVNVAYRVIADHVRTLSFAIADGAVPDKEGRGYVLRSILRRAVRYGRQTLGTEKAFLAGIVPTLVEQMGGQFPELVRNEAQIREILTDEEEAFGRTLSAGLLLFDETAADRAISAEAAFKLHDTYGFPIDLTRQMAEERGLAVDEEGFAKLMEEARERSRGGGADDAIARLVPPASTKAGLQTLGVKPTKDDAKFAGKPIRANLTAIWNGEDFDQHTEIVSGAKSSHGRVALIFDRTCFYAEMGGQVTDVGTIAGPKGEFEIEAVRATMGYVVHIGRVKRGRFDVGQGCELRLNEKRRTRTAANHTATHLLNWSLREVLGEGVEQKGSLVTPDRLRFDFSHSKALAADELAQVEGLVRERIASDLKVHADTAPLAMGQQVEGLRAVFGEVYPDPVRVVSIGVPVEELMNDPEAKAWRGYSIEFCGGTHLGWTGLAKAFALVSEESVSKGVRRIVALTGEEAREAIELGEQLATELAELQGANADDLPARVQSFASKVDTAEISAAVKLSLREGVAALQSRAKEARKEAAKAGAKGAVDASKSLEQMDGLPVVIGEVPAGLDRGALLGAMDAVRGRHPEAAVLLASGDAEEGKIAFVAKVPQGVIDRGLTAGDLVKVAAAACGGKGGGKPDAAQGGGTEFEKLGAALDAARAFAKEQLA